jgi:hypothetical protein
VKLAIVSFDWWRNPWNFSRFLSLVAGTCVGLVGILQLAYPQANLSLILAIPLALFTASFSASIGMWLYAHITQEARDAQFRFERIYQPLYDELLKEIEALKGCGLAHLQKWTWEVRESSLREFVDPRVGEALEDLRAQLAEYRRTWDIANTAARGVIQMELNEIGIRNDEFNSAGEILAMLYLDNRFMFDPNVRDLSETKMIQLGLILAKGRYPWIPDDITSRVKHLLLENQQVQERQRSVVIVLSRAETVRRMLHRRLMWPLH